MNLNQAERLYFLGIGGIGMSALARYFARCGKKVSGYDRTNSLVTEALEKEGIEIFYILDEAHLQGVDLVVYTPAISHENPEYRAALRENIPMVKRSALLGKVSETFRTLAIAGTHGKTTTSVMLSHLLRTAGVDCTAFLGGISRNLNSNFAFGKSEWLVVEADEFDRSFLTLNPEKAVITSLDADHLDIYGTAEQMRSTYHEFAEKVSGELLVHESLGGEDWKREVQTYGVEAGDFRAENLAYGELSTSFDFVSEAVKMEGLTLPFPGKHNVSNAVAALTLALHQGADPEKLREGLAGFKGIYRRFEVHFHSPELTYIDDYAHHPREIDAAIDTARALFPDRQLIVVFQPHLFSRTRDFFVEFGRALSQADAVLLLEIYPAREQPIGGVDAGLVLGQVKAPYKELCERKSLSPKIEAIIQTPTVLLTLGAGDIDQEVSKLKKWAKKKYKQTT